MNVTQGIKWKPQTLWNVIPQVKLWIGFHCVNLIFFLNYDHFRTFFRIFTKKFNNFSITLVTLPTGCWTPNDLPQCIREDLLDSGWSDSDSSSLPLVISLVTVSTGLAVIALFTTSCLVVLCRRKGGPVPPPSGPAHCKLIDTRVQILKESHHEEPKIHLLIINVSKNICLHFTQLRLSRLLI